MIIWQFNVTRIIDLSELLSQETTSYQVIKLGEKHDLNNIATDVLDIVSTLYPHQSLKIE
jgi:uncharacterized iron-regulated protein